MKKSIYTSLLIFACLFAKAQTDDLMIIEYVDWGTGAGVGIKIYNPTDQSINLSDYTIFTLHNGNTSGGTSGTLSGTLLPGKSKIYGNGEYCNDCPSGCNTLTINGVDGNDAIGIKKGITFIDVVGPLGADTQLKVDGVDDGLLHVKIARNTDNCIRYFDLAGSTIHSWPDNDVTNVTTWTNLPVVSWATNDGCLSQSDFNFEIPSFVIDADTTICEGEQLNLDYSGLGFDSYEWINENNNTASITISDSGEYVLEVRNTLLCSAQDSIHVDVTICDTSTPPPPPVVLDAMMIPNIITPNSDGINDVFVISGLDTSLLILTVYNRWGKSVYEKIDYKNNWTAEGLNDGIYYYHLLYDEKQLKGYIQVIR